MIAQNTRYGIVAGNGLLPLTLANRLSEQGNQPVIIGIEGEAGDALSAYNCTLLPLERIAYSLPHMKKSGVTHVILAGGVRRRPQTLKLRVPMVIWRDLPAALFALKRGDDGLLAAMVRMFERHGLKVIGAHDILPDHVAPYGVVVGSSPMKSLKLTIQAGVNAATIIGAHDIGQAVVAMGCRVIAVEGLEGTDQMLARVAALRKEGRIDASAKPVLIKLAKPGQELRADMPVIGPATIEGCKAAGISLICISAGSTMIMDVGNTLSQATLAGIDIYGIDPNEWAQVSQGSQLL